MTHPFPWIPAYLFFSFSLIFLPFFSYSLEELRSNVATESEKLRQKFQHESQTDAVKGFGGKFGVQEDRVDKNAVGWEYHEKLQQHGSQKG